MSCAKEIENWSPEVKIHGESKYWASYALRDPLFTWFLITQYKHILFLIII